MLNGFLGHYEMEINIELDLVRRTLAILHNQDKLWSRSLSIFVRMDALAQLNWWLGAQREAKLGAPAMRTLLAKVIELRMTQ